VTGLPLSGDRAEGTRSDADADAADGAARDGQRGGGTTDSGSSVEHLNPFGRKTYVFGAAAAPVRTGELAVVRPLRPPSTASAASAANAGRSGTTPPPGILQVVHDLSLERLLGADQETREARNAHLRRAGIGAVAVAVAGVMVYAVFPVRTALDQRAATDRRREQIEMLSQANEQLEERAERLATDAEIERIAREQYGQVMPNEESYGVLPAPDPTTTTTSTTQPGR
jgi:cell division protein FtsB